MTDTKALIDKLRRAGGPVRHDSPYVGSLFRESADELERLTAALADTTAANKTAVAMRDMAIGAATVNKRLADEQHARAEAAEAENKRLKEECADRRKRMEVAVKQIDELKEDIKAGRLLG